MTTIDNSVVNDLGLGVNRQQEVDRNKIGQDQFLKLMTTQLQNQDPFKPMENGEFLGQIAQFSTVSGIQDLQKSFSSFSTSMIPNQGLQAASLINRQVLVPSDVMPLNDNGMTGAVDVPAPATSVRVSVFDAAGQLVNNFDLGAMGPGISRYTWDGTLADGTKAPAGQYKVAVSAVVGGENLALQHFADLPVESITFGKDSSEINVNVRGLGSRSFSDILQIS